MAKQLSQDTQRAIKILLDHFDQEDRAIRERQIRQWKKYKFYWDNFQRNWWSEVAHDWRIYEPDQTGESNDAAVYDKPVNVFRAYLESIIAALSIAVPSIKCFPDDADSPLDISTAKAGDKISELVSKHNDASLLWIHALYIFCTEGLVAAYHYDKEDKSFGTYTAKEYKDVDSEIEVKTCPNCNNKLAIQESEDLLENKSENYCPTCDIEVEPLISKETIKTKEFVKEKQLPKSRQCIEVYGGLFVKVPNYARSQKECPYLIYSYDRHYSAAASRFEHLRGKFSKQGTINSSNAGEKDPYEKWGRLSNQYLGEYPNNTVTFRHAWFRPETYSILNEEDEKLLSKQFPTGINACFINDEFGDAVEEELDEHWTLTHNPLSDYIHHQPLASLLTSIQEITNDVISLALQTMEHGIPQTFASPDFLNFEAYKDIEAAPGMLIQGKSVAGKRMSDGFHEVKTATLSGEFEILLQRFQEMGQLVSGALPSLFGGAQPNSSKTAAQYSMSRSQALQRLQTNYKMFLIWWKTIFSKVIPAYIANVAEDERTVKKDETGNFVNVLIRKSDLSGKIGSVELEASENIPLTYAQQNDVIMKLLTSANPEILSALFTPENLPMVAQTIGLNNFVLPGRDDKEKQYEEIQILLGSAPIPDTMSGQVLPSVEVDPLVDNHRLEADIIRRWCVSDVGRQTKIDNPMGYQNVLLHLQQHVMNIMPIQEPANNKNAPNKEKPNGQSQQPTIQ